MTKLKSYSLGHSTVGTNTSDRIVPNHSTFLEALWTEGANRTASEDGHHQPLYEDG